MLERQNPDCSSVSEKCLFYRSTDENILFTGLYECALSGIYLFEFRVPFVSVYKLQLMAFMNQLIKEQSNRVDELRVYFDQR